MSNDAASLRSSLGDGGLQKWIKDGNGNWSLAYTLSAGLGLVVFADVDGSAWYKGGHDDGTANLALCVERRKRCVVMLSNDVRAERLFPELAEAVLGGPSMRWAWEYDWYRDEYRPPDAR